MRVCELFQTREQDHRGEGAWGRRTHVVAVAHENGAVGPPERTRVQLRVGHRPDLAHVLHVKSVKRKEHVATMELHVCGQSTQHDQRHDTHTTHGTRHKTRHDTQHVYLAVVEGLEEGGPHHRRQLGRGHPSQVVGQLPVFARNRTANQAPPIISKIKNV
jgi:hypothetical protein